MAAYDSDSSADLDDYTETTTLLGYASKEPTDDNFSQLGGTPTWLDGKTAPSAALAKCKVCNDYMCLLLQLNGDLPEKFSGHERRLYLFGCRRKTCRRKEGSVRGLRASRISKTQAQAPATAKTQSDTTTCSTPSVNLGNQLFGGTSAMNGGGGNPFGGNPFSSSTSQANPFASASSLAAKSPQKTDMSSLPEAFASKAQITDSSPSSDPAFKAPKPAERPEPWPAKDKQPAPYPTYYLDADCETLDKPKLPAAKVTGTLEDAEMGGTSSSSADGADEKQLFESSMDKTFQKFADRLEQNPEQVLRYEFGGHPLLYSSTDGIGKALAPEHTSAKVSTTTQSSGIPQCTTCGSQRVFELQLTPHAITELEADEMSLDGMDWGTIIMAVCSQDCVPVGTVEGSVGYVEEWIGVQWEELGEKRR